MVTLIRMILLAKTTEKKLLTWRRSNWARLKMADHKVFFQKVRDLVEKEIAIAC